MIALPSGSKANKTGTVLERFILSHLGNQHYTFVDRDHFTAACFIGQPIYTRHFHVGSSIYGTPQFCDFIVYHPKRWPSKLIIESKWQQTGGSVDEKFPYLVLNIQMQYQSPTIIVLDGGGYKAGAADWLRKQAGNRNLVEVFNMPQFAKWVNNGNL